MNTFIAEATQSKPVVTTSTPAPATRTAPVNPTVANNAPAQVIESEVDVLARQWQEAKQAEEHAKERRYQIEGQLAELVGVKEEGTLNAEGKYFKVKTVGKLTRSLNDKALQSDWDSLPAEIKKCVKWKSSLDTRSLRALEEMRSDLMPVMANYLTTKPAKPSVSVEAI